MLSKIISCKPGRNILEYNIIGLYVLFLFDYLSAGLDDLLQRSSLLEPLLEIIADDQNHYGK
jgi:hypothetical protein